MGSSIKTIGIDLGTTFSLISYFDGKKPVIIPNALGENLTPSVVSVDENDNIFVGKIAREMLITNPDCAAKVFKRTMGMKLDYKLGNKTFNSIELSSFVIKTLVSDAKRFLGEDIKKVVISVPAYFNDIQRKSTKMAGELAGVEVIRIVSEPTCAALAYGITEETDNNTYLIFDLGGGTFDVSILEMNDGIIEVMSIAGDNYLGGEDFTEVLLKMFLKQNALNISEISLKNLNIINHACEKAKVNLGKSKKIKIKCIIDEKELSAEIKIDEFEAECNELLEKIMKTTARAMIDAKKKIEDIDHVVLVGGSTKLELIKKYVVNLFNKNPLSSHNPDEVVALGIGVQCGMIERSRAIQEIILTDVCSYTLGTSVSRKLENGIIKDGFYLPIIERNTTIPVSKVERLYTMHDMQDKIRVDILQGESFNASENLLIGEMYVNVPKKPAGEECIDVRYTYNINGILEVEVVVISTGEKAVCVFEKSKGVFTDEEIQEKLEEIQYLKIHPRDRESNKLVLQKAKSLYEQSYKDVRKQLSEYIMEFEIALEKQDNLLIAETRKRLEKFMKDE